MSIQEVRGRIKTYLTDDRVFIPLLVAAVAVSSFFIGRASVEQSSAGIQTAAITMTNGAERPRAEQLGNEAGATSSNMKEIAGGNVQATSTEKGAYVASRKGTKYHLPWCPGARTISEENKRWFDSKAEAEAAGYEPAKNCKGI